MPSRSDDDDSGEEEERAFANPQMPSRYRVVHDDDDDGGRQKLSNDDFRKLMMTPRAPTSETPNKPSLQRHSSQTSEEEDAATRRRKKKAFYAKLKKKEEEERKELEQRYRDRAKERRDQEEGGGPPGSSDPIKTTADYKAVAPDAKSNQTLAERRRLAIQESKYLGGDMEHTHLVKGLDYALLEKVRTEISTKENEDEQMEDALNTKKEDEDPESKVQFNTKMARNIFRVMFRRQLPERNELFAPRRMAYVVDLEDEFAESDIPTTLLRSKADCPTLESSTLSTNDIIINKLTQILSYLRQGDRKLKKKEKGIKLKDEEKLKHADESIYADIGNYVPSYSKSKTKKERDDDGGHERIRDKDRSDRDRSDRDRSDRDRGDRDRSDRERGDRDRRDRRHDRERRSYFEKPAEEDEEKRSMPSAKEFVRSINERFAGTVAANWADAEQPEGRKAEKGDKQMEKLRMKTEINSYAECYPGMMESADAIDDSDEETDYTKMDQGNKKGPVGRWDFETQEEYSDYMSNKEAMPKAAFQYGVKMADGRRTRRAGPKDEKKELDREWQQIQSIITKRKNMATGGEPASKSAKH